MTIAHHCFVSPPDPCLQFAGWWGLVVAGEKAATPAIKLSLKSSATDGWTLSRNTAACPHDALVAPSLPAGIAWYIACADMVNEQFKRVSRS